MNNQRGLGKNGLVDGIGPATVGELTTLLEQWASTYGPTVLLGLDETSGTTAVDASGNGHDLEHQNTFSVGETGLFSGDGKGVDYANGVNYGYWSSYPSIGPDHSIVVSHRLDNGAGAFALFACDPGNRIMPSLRGSASDYLGWYDEVTATWRTTPYTPGAGMEALYAFDFDSLASTGTVYVNGLPVFTDTYSDVSTSGDALLGSYNQAGSGICNGLYSLFMHIAGTLTHEQYHQQALDVGAAPSGGHYYKETIVDDLGLATLGSQGDVVCHLPLFETAGAQALDVSMYENHHDFVNGPSLGASPVVEGFSSSVNLGVSTEHLIADPVVDVSSSSCTLAIALRLDGTDTIQDLSTDRIIGIHDPANEITNRLFIGAPSGGGVLAQLFDGTNVAEIKDTGATSGNTLAVCLRYDHTADTIDLWLDGSHVGQASTSAVSVNAGTDQQIIGSTGAFWSSPISDVQHLITTSTALSNTDCAALSNPTFA